jgi:hypothetical protein
MASKRTWLWIVLAVVGLGLVCLVALAGAGVYFVANHIDSSRTTSAAALQTFDAERARFKDQPPLFELDRLDNPRITKPLADLPTSPVRPDALWILAWNPDEARTVKISIPFWMLRLGRRKIDIFNDSRDFNLRRLNLDVDELERIGPALVFDFRSPTGERVLVWTQ